MHLPESKRCPTQEGETVMSDLSIPTTSATSEPDMQSFRGLPWQHLCASVADEAVLSRSSAIHQINSL